MTAPTSAALACSVTTATSGSATLVTADPVLLMVPAAQYRQNLALAGSANGFIG